MESKRSATGPRVELPAFDGGCDCGMLLPSCCATDWYFGLIYYGGLSSSGGKAREGFGGAAKGPEFRQESGPESIC